MQKARRVAVWFSTLLCILFIAFQAGAAPAPACPGPFSGTLDGTSPTQTGRLLRNGGVSACGSTKANPGLFNAIAVPYNVYTFTNGLATPACYSFTLSTPTTRLFFAAYSSFNPATPAANYLADAGGSAATTTFGLDVAGGASIDVVVHVVTAGFNDSYTLTVTNCGEGASVALAANGPNPSVFGETAAFSATLSGSSGTPTGTVTFLDGVTSLGTSSIDGAGLATLSTAALPVGTRSITAAYSGDGVYAAVTSLAVSQVVNQASTTTTVASSQNPQVFGQSVTFTSTVAPVVPGAGTATGTVTFYDGVASLGTGALSGGQATFATSALTAGSHNITAVYGGDANFAGSTSSILAQVMDPAATTVTVTGTPSTTTYGASVQFDATVSAAAGGTPTGNVTFKDGTTQLAVVPLVAGTASYTTSTLTVGTHTIVAEYGGDVNHNAASGTTAQTVNLAPSTTTLASLTNPSVFGQAVTFTGSVTGSVGTPTGTLTAYDGAVMVGSATLDAGGNATLTTSMLPVGSHPLTIVYGGDAIYATSTSAVVVQVVNKASAIVAIASSQNPQGVGMVVTFTATVSANPPGSGTPGGDVSLYDNAFVRNKLGTVTLAAGVATFDISTLAVGTHTMNIDYAGDGSFNLAMSPTLVQIIAPNASGVTLTATPSPSRFGDNVQVQASVAAGSGGTATGMVTFSDGATPLGTVALDGSGNAALAVNTFTVGSHSLSASYAGDGNHNAATATIAHVVGRALTTTVMASSANPSVFGQTTTLTATVTSAAGTPSGTVEFKEGTTILGTVTLNGSGVASIDLSDLSVGDHAIVASYSGAATFAPSSIAEPTQVVNKATTTVAVTSSSNPIIVGSAVTFTATLQVTAPGAGAPSGTVTFKEGATTLGTAALSGSTASFVTSALTVGSHDITAVYAGDANFLTSTSAALTQAVLAAGVTVALSVSPNSTVYGQNAILTAILTATTGGAPTGTVEFTEGSTTLGTGTLSGGSAIFVVGTLAVGNHSITATYEGDGTHAPGANATAQLAVTKRDTRTTLASATNPSRQGQAVALTATVTVQPLAGDAGGATGGLTPLSGNVTFSDGQTVLGTSTLSNGTATLSVSTLSVGSHAVSASYQGAANYDESSSTALVQVVNALEGGVEGGGPIDAGVRDVSVDTTVPPDTTVPADTVPTVDAFRMDVLPDAGTAVDTGRAPDAVVSDAAVADASAPRPDAAADAGKPTGGGETDDDGCSCRLAAPSSNAGGLYAFGLALGLVALRRNRRTKR